MEEVSSLDSIHADDGEDEVTTRHVNIEERRKLEDLGEEDDEDEGEEYEDAQDGEEARDTSDRGDDGPVGEDDFEPISEGTLDVDEENSQETLTEVAPPSAPTDDGTGSKEADEETHNVNDFETVDGSESANTSAAADTEADMLGQSDMTLPDKRDDIANKSADSAGVMDVDNDDNEQEDEVEGLDESADVEMRSVSNSPHDAAGSQEGLPDGDAKDNEESQPHEESMEATGGVGEEVTDKADNIVGKDVVDTNDAGEEEGTTAGDTAAAEGDEAEDEQGDKENEDNEAGDGDVDAMDDGDGENEDQPVENVQEPEESDVCLLPDDTEVEMTEAEKEQAILARENAEKEDAEEEAEKNKGKVAAAAAAAAAEKDDIDDQTEGGDEEEAVEEDPREADVKARAKQAGPATAAKAANESSEETIAAMDSAVDADEPLLKEMQSKGSTSEAGCLPTTTKTIIAWIVARTEKCVHCSKEKLCGFRYRDSDTSEMEYICGQLCADLLLAAQPGKYFIRRKKFLVEEVNSISSRNAAGELAEGEQASLTSDSSKEVETEAAQSDAAENNGGSAKMTTEAASALKECLYCKEMKLCQYFLKQDDETFYICNDDCYNLLNAEEPDKFKLKRHSIRVRNIGATLSNLSPALHRTTSAESRVVARTAVEAEAARIERMASFTRRCAECITEISLGEKNLVWETMDFCNEICLGKYQRKIGSKCQTCQDDVSQQALGKYCVRFGFDVRQFCCAACLNEYKKGLKTCSCCQKDISGGNEGFLAPVGDKEQFKDFCSQTCMRHYDSMCNPRKKLRTDTCTVCNHEKPVRVEILLDDKEHTFCSNPCFSAFKFVSNIVADQCGMCAKYFERKGADAYTIYSERRTKVFCTRICLNVYIIVNRSIVSCQWCKVKKYNFDLIYKQQDEEEILMCSINCLTLYGVSINALTRTVIKCDNCNTSAPPQYHLTMSDASMRNFCTYQCVMQFQSQFARTPLTLENEGPTQSSGNATHKQSSSAISGGGKSGAPFPTGLPKRVKLRGFTPHSTSSILKQQPTVPVISTVASLANPNIVRRGRCRGRKAESPGRGTLPPSGNSGRGRPRKHAVIDYARSPSPVSLSPPRSNSGRRGITAETGTVMSRPSETKIITVPPYPPTVRNVQTHCKPHTVTNGVQCGPSTAEIGCQTSKDYSNKVLIPVPVPIYIPQPMYMYSAPFPVPVPIPLPIPVPIFIPTTRNSAQGILKEIKKIQDKMPADPFEAELLMMAEMVAEEKRPSDSDSDEEIKPDPNIVTSLQQDYANSVQTVEVASANNSYGEDMLQMALKMATGEYDQQPTVDLESAMTANTISNPPPGMVAHDNSLDHASAAQHLMQEQQTHHMIDTPPRATRGRKRGALGSPTTPRNHRAPLKRQRVQEMESAEVATTTTSTPAATHTLQSTEKPDVNMCLKYTFGVNAWKQWVMTKNADMEKSSIRRRAFKTELLQMTADELNYSLCLFVKEVRKPNGTEYAPDTIYYLVLGIQQYLYENGRIDNIFTDPYYERFTDCLDEVARKFSVLYNDSQYIVTRVEEEHLWECKQLGAHSPHVLLSTLMFFNTKHFNLTTVEEHMQLSFSHIMKHWKRSAQNTKTSGTRNVLLRFYPPQAGLDANPRKKKVYEQQENEDNPLRCPVRLYEFYLSKCPESVKTRNDVFYLQPERSCVPDSPVWYSTQALSKDALQKMLHRVKMVKEINIALLTS